MISTNNILAIAAGAVVGSVVTWLCTKKYYKDLAKEEVEAVREIYRNMRDKEVEKKKEEIESKIKAREYTDIVKQYTVPDAPSVIIEELEERGDNYIPPVIISEDDVPDLDEYGLDYLVYYSDGTMIFDIDPDQTITPEDYIGEAAYALLADYESDTIYVRNDNNHTCYEITKSGIEYEFAQSL